MSELRVALVAEGPTDVIVVEAALKKLLPHSFVLTPLQPESKHPKLGGGWGGVARWCDEFANRGYNRIEDDPTLPDFDLFIIHVDADVADKAYADYGPKNAAIAAERGWPTLPNAIPCPPPRGSVDAMRNCLLAWTGMQEPGARTVLCIPSKAIDAWLVAAVFNDGHALLANLECNLNVEGQLAALPMNQRIKKSRKAYQDRAGYIRQQWPVVRQRCTQADRFSNDVEAVIGRAWRLT